VHNCNSETVRSPKNRYCLLRLFKHYRGAFPGNNNISLTCCTFFSFFESQTYLGYSRRWSYVLFWLWCWQFYDTSQYLKLENKEINILEWIIGIDLLISKFSWKSIRFIIFLGSNFKVAIWWVPLWFEKYSTQYFAWKIRNIKNKKRKYIPYVLDQSPKLWVKQFMENCMGYSLSLFPPTLFNFASPDYLQIASMKDSCESLIEFIVHVFFPYLFSQHHWQWHVPFDPSIHLCKLSVRLVLV